MSQRLDDLRQLLSADSLARALVARLDKCRSKPSDQRAASVEGHDLLEAHLMEDYETLRTRADDIFDKYVIRKLRWPPLVTLDDLKEVACFVLPGLSDGDSVSSFSRFRLLMCEPIARECRSGPKIELGLWSWPEARLGEAVITEELWRTTDDADDAGIMVSLRRPEPSGPYPAIAWLTGAGSKSAMLHASEDLRSVFPSIARSIAVLTTAIPSNVTISSPDGGIVLTSDNPAKRWEVTIGSAGSDYTDDTMEEWNRRVSIGFGPPFSELTSEQGRRFVDACLAACFQPEAWITKSALCRVKNAVLLLAEADSHRNGAISLSLCFSAVEALVCSRAEQITEELARRTAALLEPNSLDRPGSIQAIKSLYKLRCNALHGSSFDDVREAHPLVRRLAAAVLRAMIEWIDYCRRMGDPPTQEEFLKQLQNVEMTGTRMVGVPGLQQYLPRS
jgi:hypothetical protein